MLHSDSHGGAGLTAFGAWVATARRQRAEQLAELIGSVPSWCDWLQSVVGNVSRSADSDLGALVSVCTPVAAEQPASVHHAVVASEDSIDAALGDERGWGPLASTRSCNVLRDPCMIHATVAACVEVELCGWCSAPAFSHDAVVQGRHAASDAATARGMCMSRLWGSGNDTTGGGRCRVALTVVVESQPDAFTRAHPTVSTVWRLEWRGGDWLLGKASPSQCALIVTRAAPLFVAFGGNSQMAYHFMTETATQWHANALARMCVDHLRCHVWVAGDRSHADRGYLQWAALYSNACPMEPRHLRAAGSLPAQGDGRTGVCYLSDSAAPATVHPTSGSEIVHLTGLPLPRTTGVDASGHSLGLMMAGGWRLGFGGLAHVAKGLLCSRSGVYHVAEAAGASDAAAAAACKVFTQSVASRTVRDRLERWVVAAAGAAGVRPVGHHITVIRRTSKRFIFNEPAVVNTLVNAAKQHCASGETVQVTVARLEEMSLAAQMALFRETTLLVGMHGSGLVNGMFLHAGAGVVQLVPTKLEGADQFFEGPAVTAGAAYAEYSHSDVSDASLHTHFLHGNSGADGSRSGSVSALRGAWAKGSSCCGPAAYFSFWINQDLHVDAVRLQQVVQHLQRGGTWRRCW